MEPRFYSSKLSLCSPWHAWNHSLARVTDATRTFWFLIIQFPKQYSSSSKHLLLFISLFFSDSCWAHWMTLTLQPNPKSKHFTFYIFFFQRRSRVLIIQAITDSISGTFKSLLFLHIINNWNFMLTRKVILYNFKIFICSSGGWALCHTRQTLYHWVLFQLIYSIFFWGSIIKKLHKTSDSFYSLVDLSLFFNYTDRQNETTLNFKCKQAESDL